MSEACNYCAAEPCRCKPSRLERVAEALFVALILERDRDTRSDTTVGQVAEKAILRARIFDKLWRDKVELE